MPLRGIRRAPVETSHLAALLTTDPSYYFLYDKDHLVTITAIYILCAPTTGTTSTWHALRFDSHRRRHWYQYCTLDLAPAPFLGDGNDGVISMTCKFPRPFSPVVFTLFVNRLHNQDAAHTLFPQLPPKLVFDT